MPIGDSKTCTKCEANKPLDAFYRQRDCKDGRRPECSECTKERISSHRTANIEQARAYDKMRSVRDADRKRKAARRWYAQNTERAKASARAYYEANREAYAAYSAKRKALKRNAEHQPYTRREIYERDNGHCKICGTSLPYEPNGFHLDHIVPLALGGADTPANLQLACQPCNRAKWMNLEGQIHLPV